MSKLGILTRTLTPETTVSCFLSAGEPCRALSFPPRGSLHRPPLSSPYPEEPGSLHQPRLQVPLCPDVPQVCPPQHQDVAPYSQPFPSALPSFSDVCVHVQERETLRKLCLASAGTRWTLGAAVSPGIRTFSHSRSYQTIS